MSIFKVGQRVVQKYEPHDAKHTATVTSVEGACVNVIYDNGNRGSAPDHAFETENWRMIMERNEDERITSRGGVPPQRYRKVTGGKE